MKKALDSSSAPAKRCWRKRRVRGRSRSTKQRFCCEGSPRERRGAGAPSPDAHHAPVPPVPAFRGKRVRCHSRGWEGGLPRGPSRHPPPPGRYPLPTSLWRAQSRVGRHNEKQVTTRFVHSGSPVGLSEAGDAHWWMVLVRNPSTVQPQ